MSKHYVFPERSFTLEHVPAEPSLVIYGTVNVYTGASTEAGVPDRSGFVSSITQPDEPVESRDEARPLLERSLPLDEDDAADILRILQDLGVADSEDGSTIYASDPKCYDLASDETWVYAIHAHIRRWDPLAEGFVDGWVEDKVRILK